MLDVTGGAADRSSVIGQPGYFHSSSVWLNTAGQPARILQSPVNIQHLTITGVGWFERALLRVIVNSKVIEMVHIERTIILCILHYI